ncbi:hypothetical protein Tco_1488877, partial [Tanacetum coccineum]
MCRLASHSTFNGIIRMTFTQECCGGQDMALLPRDKRHQYLRFEGLQYTDTDIADFEVRLGRIYDREVHRVQVFDFGGLTELMDEGLKGRMLMGYRDAQGQSHGLGAANVLYLLAQYLFRHAKGRKSGARLSEGDFIGRLAHHFGLVGDDWAWVAQDVERQPVVAVTAPGGVEDASDIDEGTQAVT